MHVPTNGSARPRPPIAIAAVAGLLCTGAAQVVVDTCGQELDGDGILMADLDTATLPKLKDTSCETSHVNGPGISGSSWGLCLLE